MGLPPTQNKDWFLQYWKMFNLEEKNISHRLEKIENWRATWK